MRILLVAPGPRFSTYDVYKYYKKALSDNGHDVIGFNYHDWFAYYVSANASFLDEDPDSVDVQRRSLNMGAQMMLAKMARTLPDLILTISGIAMPDAIWDWVNEFRRNLVKDIMTAILFTESPYIDDRQLDLLGSVDFGFTMDKYSLPKFKVINDRSAYIGHSFSEDVHYPRGPDKEYSADVFMVGTGFPERRDLLMSIDWSGIDLKLFGDWEVADQQVDGTPLEDYVVKMYLDNEEEVPKWYSNSRVSLNIFRTARWPEKMVKHIDGTEAYSASPRCFGTMACGGLLLTDSRPELFDLFDVGKDLLVFNSPEDMHDKVRYYIRNEGESDSVRESGYNAVQRYSYHNRASELVTYILENK